MAMTMTLAFDEQAIPLTEAESTAVLRLVRELRDRLYMDDDVQDVRNKLHDTVGEIMTRHTRVQLDAIHIDINADASRITTRRVHAAEE